MAKVLCIPSEQVDKIKAALKAGKIDLIDLYNKNSSKERRAVWEPFVGTDLAKFINTKFERAAASSSKTAMQDFVEEVASPQEKKTGKTKNILDKIKALEEADLLNVETQEATFTDLVSARLGVDVNAEEIQQITEKAENIDRLKTEVFAAEAQDLPTKDYFKQLVPAQVDFHAALTDMDKYMNALTPTHNLKVITGTIFRGNMLLNIPPAVVNTISNAVQGTMQALERRIANRITLETVEKKGKVKIKVRLKGKATGLNSEFATEYFKMVVKVFHETGYDVSRMYAEDIRLGEHIVHSEGPGIVRKTGRGISKVVFKYLLGYSDVISAAAAGADSRNVATAKLAKAKGLKGKEAQDYAQEVFKESIKLQPNLETDAGVDGVITREQSIADAEYATWTNKGFIAERSLKLRDWLNDTTGDLQLGFWNIPFIKTGANVIQFGIESSPIGGIAALAKLKSAVTAMKDKVDPDMKPMQDVIRLAVRSGLGTLLSYIIVSLIPPDDFLSAYEVASQKQRDQLGIKKGVYNAVKIGDTWVSLDFFGALGAGFVGMMYAKKYGKGATDTAFKLAQGIGAQALQVPGIRDFEDLAKSMKRILTAKTKEEAGTAALGGTINSVRARVIPGILNTLAKGTDPVVRTIDRDDLLARTKAGIPGLRQTLPVKIDQTTGLEVQGEGFLTNLLFGSRVKKANESALIDEITRLDAQGEAPAIADIERSSKQVQGLKTQISDSLYQQALEWYGREYGRRAGREILRASYHRASDEDKKKMLNKIRAGVRSDMLKKFHFRKSRGKK